MNLVNQLQESAERDEVLMVLRKAKRLASKLDVSEMDDWIRSEMDGYPNGASVPDYRRVNGTLV